MLTTVHGHVLLVDDDPHLRRVIQRFLDRSGFGTTAVGSAEDALALLADGAFDAIVTDIRMPGMDGEAFLARLREQHPDLLDRLIVTSGAMASPSPGGEDLLRGVRFLQKPYHLSALTELLKTLLDLHSSRLPGS